jgi:glycosidase
MSSALYPSLAQVNTRVWLTALSRQLGRRATLDDIPDSDLEALAGMGFDWVWFLSVWQIGELGRRIARTIPELCKEFEQTLPDLADDDIQGSGFAITGYTVHESLGGDAALARLRERLRKFELRLMLDFIPNHTGIDHPWIEEHPDYFIRGTEQHLIESPKRYTLVHRKAGDLVLAYGRDPYFDGWTDTLQLNYGNPALQRAMSRELLKVASQCDGVRCDMAMLVLPEVFRRTWGVSAEPFWPNAIRQVRAEVPDFCFMAEVYWDLEWTMQQQGFDYAYDKRLYDRLREGHARPVRDHFVAGLDYQNKLTRFLENHDEARAAIAFPGRMHEAAAVITFLSPGLRFFHQGQLQGRLKRISPHLVRAPEEPVNEALKSFYERLLSLLRQPIFRDGKWQLIDCAAAWEGNPSCDSFICFAWEHASPERRVIVVVNYANHPSQCRLRLPFSNLRDRKWRFQDLLGKGAYDWDGAELETRGLYLDMTPWQSHAFDIQSI